jgi:hypothetical protein
MGEVSKSAASLSRDKANEIVKYLLEKYEANLEKAPDGFVFEELYDARKMVPNQEYLDLYKSVKEEIAIQGLDFSEA